MDVEEDSDASSSVSEVPSTTASVTLPSVTSPPVISTSPVTAVRSTVVAPTSRPTVAVTTPVNVTTGSTTAASVSAPLASVSTASTVSTASASKSSVSAPSPKKPRTVISREIFLQGLAKYYPTVDLPSFDNVTGKEWDTRAKAYIRQQVKIVFEDKRIGITKGDLATWDFEDLGWLRNDLCDILSIRNYLTDYVLKLLEGYWMNSREDTKK
ncbi:uncharacterized protein LOC122951678 [Acropora millepora]|uniref:uncharacterized protein LOC122951678 n=1 Tax=Acropora millepora TaxID=45264 RepID=UPI001CF18E8C|nr:uncharacterized protein LOC122951678 [Acropora millepora]